MMNIILMRQWHKKLYKIINGYGIKQQQQQITNLNHDMKTKLLLNSGSNKTSIRHTRTKWFGNSNYSYRNNHLITLDQKQQQYWQNRRQQQQEQRNKNNVICFIINIEKLN